MTFYELIRNSLLADSVNYVPPGILMQAVFDALRKMEPCAADPKGETSDSS